MLARRGFIGVVATLAALLVCAPLASAGEATVGTKCDESGSHGPCVATATYLAAPGENNDVTVDTTTVPPSTQIHVRFSDASASMRPGSGCTAIDDHTSDCPLPAADDQA